MNIITSRFIFRSTLIVAAATFGAMAHSAIAAPVALDAQCTPHLRSVDQRIYDKAHESPDALRRYLSIAAGPMANDAAEATDWAVRIDLARRRCIEAQTVAGLETRDDR